MAVSALTVLLSNTLEESQFVAAPAQRKRLILEGPLAALQGPDDSEDEAAGGRRGMQSMTHVAGLLLLLAFDLGGWLSAARSACLLLSPGLRHCDNRQWYLLPVATPCRLTGSPGGC